MSWRDPVAEKPKPPNKRNSQAIPPPSAPPHTPPDKPPNKTPHLEKLGEQIGQAVVRELLAKKALQDAQQVLYGARTPTQENRDRIHAADQRYLRRGRERLMIFAALEDTLGIVQKPDKPPSETLDGTA